MNERTVFLTALEKEDTAQRRVYLDEACGGDAALRERVEALLRSHEREGKFLDVPAVEQLAAPGLQDPAGDTQEEVPVNADESRSLDFLAPSDKPGSLGRLGHYDIQKVIGQGGMGIVLQAYDEHLHRVVAIKVMAAQLAINATARKRFVREAQAAAAVCDDHIVTIHAVDEGSPLPYLVMQYVAGLSLQQRLDRDGPLELRELLRIGMQTASGLAAAHAQGLIHRDIKPANILLENGVERVKITDFGLARAAADASLTQLGVVAGTPQYMAPEQARGEALDHRADLFSLGSVLYAMCTGRAAFRGSNSIAVLKRVCEETPTPIRETNPEIPDWLVAIIEKLHAKDPAQRYPSAAEVAELLGRHLAQVQHPSVAPLPPSLVGRGARGEKSKSARRRWAVAAAAVLFCVFGGLGFTEATGVTSLRATVIRIFTAEGTLIVEVDDPAVKVTIEGDGGIVITGAGLQEVRLKPGSYKVQAVKDGKPVRLDQELVTITRGDKQVVRVRLEGDDANTAAVPKAEPRAFVLLAVGKESKFNTLAEAVQGASDGDTIEIRGNGPFVCTPIKITQALTIRAGEAFRPVIQLSSSITTDSPLVLEGLELQRLGEKAPVEWGEALVSTASSSSLYVANCRFRERSALPCVVTYARSCFVRNCEFLSPHESAIAWGWPPGKQCVIDNCVAMGVGCGILQLTHDIGLVPHDTSVRLTRSTVMAANAMRHWLNFEKSRELTKQDHAIPVEAADNIFDVTSVLYFCSLGKTLQPKEVEPLLRRTLAWRERQNVYTPGASSFDVRVPVVLPNGPKNLTDWTRFWGSNEAGSIEVRVKYQGGDLRSKLRDAPETVTPDDFRLRPDSAGYKAGKDGKDLGADVDLVGPGPAYERWRKTPAYQQWLKDSGQVKK